MPISAGSVTIGTSGTYATFAAFFADITSPLTGDLTATVISDQTVSSQAYRGALNLGGFTLEIKGDVAMTGSTGVGRQVFNSAGSVDAIFMEDVTNGTLLIHDFRTQKSGAAPDRTRAVFHIRPNGTTYATTRYYNIIYNGASLAGRGIRFTGSGTHPIQIWNCSSRNALTTGANTDGGSGISIVNNSGAKTVENCTSHGDYNGFECGNATQLTMRNCCGFGVGAPGTGKKFQLATASTAVSCWSIDTSVNDFAVKTNCQASIDPSSQITTATGANYLRLNDTIYSPSLAMDGAFPVVPGNNTGIRGDPRPGVLGWTSVGIDQRDITGAPPNPAMLGSFSALGLGLGLGLLRPN